MPNAVHILHLQNNAFHIRWRWAMICLNCWSPEFIINNLQRQHDAHRQNEQREQVSQWRKQKFTSSHMSGGKSECGWRGVYFYESWESTRVVLRWEACQHNSRKHPSHPTLPNFSQLLQIHPEQAHRWVEEMEEKEDGDLCLLLK